jgi:polyisoprenyl-phosphate glycosyltransferase
MLLSIVSPVYRAEKIIPTLVRRIAESVQQITFDYEIILVDDGSKDDSWGAIAAISAQNPKVVGIKLSRNFGQHHAITAGLDCAKGEWVVVMDCDLQDQPEEIPRFYEKAMEGYDVVLGRRYQRQDTFMKRLSSKVFYETLGYLAGFEYDSTVANFGIYNRKVIDSVVSMRESIRNFVLMIQWVGFRQAKIDITHASRFEGESSYTFLQLVNLALNIALSYSDKPIRLVIQIGALIALTSFLFALSILYRYFTGGVSVLGYTSLIFSIWFLSGCIMMTLGVIGLYVGKTFEATKQRPIYIVQQKINGSATAFVQAQHNL